MATPTTKYCYEKKDWAKTHVDDSELDVAAFVARLKIDLTSCEDDQRRLLEGFVSGPQEMKIYDGSFFLHPI